MFYIKEKSPTFVRLVFLEGLRSGDLSCLRNSNVPSICGFESRALRYFLYLTCIISPIFRVCQDTFIMSDNMSTTRLSSLTRSGKTQTINNPNISDSSDILIYARLHLFENVSYILPGKF